jgi:ABC-type multidrug transport system fused ATPase/permease subunit
VQAAAAAYGRLAPLLAPPPPLDREPPRAGWRADRIAGLTDGPDPPTASPARPAAPAAVGLEDVTFTYPGAGEPALRQVTLDVPPGALLAVTGPVGSGKSALARLVAGLYPPDSGQVRVDGADPSAWQAADRALLGYLPQGHPVFSGTIADNVLLADPRGAPEDDRLPTAVTVAALDRDLALMPTGLDTGVGELGVQVSGGQRQRIALARALAASAVPPRLLVLDDPFSGLDVETEARVVEALRAAVGPGAPPERRATVLLFSTRLTSFPQADRIAVLDRGRVTETGDHTQLLAAGGVYARIFRAQHHLVRRPAVPAAGTAVPEAAR